jgi:hypothetical protein
LAFVACCVQYVELVAKQQSNWKELAGYKEDKPAQAKAKL